MSDIGSTTTNQFGSSGVAEALGADADQIRNLVARSDEPTAESQVFTGATGGAELLLANGQAATTVKTRALESRTLNGGAELGAARNAARRRLHEMRHELLDELEAGTLDAFGQARLSDVERELDALDALDVATAIQSDTLWAKIEALAGRVLASAPSQTPS
jgi:hypothetical protein